jgi:hypothetical protein
VKKSINKSLKWVKLTYKQVKKIKAISNNSLNLFL